MLIKNRGIGVFLLLSLILLISACAKPYLTITDAKTAAGIDDKLMPVQAMDTFPTGTTKVFCWFKWQDAKIDTKIVARWNFVTDNIHILNYQFAIPRKDGTGSVSLAMPEGKVLPAGLYKIDLTIGESVIKSLTFKVK